MEAVALRHSNAQALRATFFPPGECEQISVLIDLLRQTMPLLIRPRLEALPARAFAVLAVLIVELRLLNCDTGPELLVKVAGKMQASEVCLHAGGHVGSRNQYLIYLRSHEFDFDRVANLIFEGYQHRQL